MKPKSLWPGNWTSAPCDRHDPVARAHGPRAGRRPPRRRSSTRPATRRPVDARDEEARSVTSTLLDGERTAGHGARVGRRRRRRARRRARQVPGMNCPPETWIGSVTPDVGLLRRLARERRATARAPAKTQARERAREPSHSCTCRRSVKTLSCEVRRHAHGAARERVVDGVVLEDQARAVGQHERRPGARGRDRLARTG